MNKKLFALALSLGLTAGAAGAITANAAIKETTVGDNIITEAGIVNEVDWDILSDTKDTSYSTNVKGDVLSASNVVWGAGWLVPWDTTSFANGAVTLEFDAFNLDETFGIAPYVGSDVTTKVNTIWLWPNTVSNPNGLIVGEAGDEGGANLSYYSDEALTNVLAAEGSKNCAFSTFPTENWKTGVHIVLTFKADGTMGVKSVNLKNDGSYDTTVREIWIKNAFEGLDSTTKYYFGLWYYGTTLFDNVKLTSGTTTVFETDFSGTDWNETQGFSTPGKILNVNGKPKKVAEIVLNPENNDRIVSANEIKVDSRVEKAFVLTGKIDFRTLGKKFGVALGLDEQTTAIDAEGVSYIYFTQNEDVTYVNLMKDGVDGTAISLSTDLVAAEFIDFEIAGYTNGTVILSSGSTELATFKIENMDGYLAFVTDGDGKAEVALDVETALKSYSFRGSVGEAFGSNFNTNWINPERWEMLNGNPVMFNDNAEARGILVEDGEMKFAGVGHGSYFGTTEEYADYVVEFLYKEGSDVDKPKLLDSYTLGYSYLTVITGAGMTTTPSGWAESTMITFVNGQIEIRDFKQVPNLIEVVPIVYDFRPTEAGAYKTTAIKIVAVNNKITVYYQEVVDGTDPTAAAYIKGCEFTTVDTYGKINFVATEAGVFSVDNIRITPVDDPDATTMAANLANYVDFAPIADENRPYDLNAPVITLTENVIGWTAVEGATGYIVNVNGTKTEVGADVLSYTITATEAGDYTITVVAKGNGDWIGDSDQSNAVEFTIEAPKNDTKQDAKKKKGCGSVLAGGSVLTMLAAAGVALVATKKKED